MLFDPYPTYQPRDFIFKIATTEDEMRGYWNLRREVFCEEQHVFENDDRDAIDDHSIPLICATLVAGMVDEVVGLVRIDEREPRLWYGSRLCVKQSFRRLTQLSPGVSIRNHQPVYKGFGALGAGLIYKAVSTANAIGCDRFLANVQEQNEKFFHRLHWQPLGETQFHGLRHIHMQADLAHYPPAEMVA
ncbi:histone acetyltransferase [Phragmitibacter flavus]|uniref:Histone acetyltransferase n=1 Tax=Phragmitibacter flavus TaxID=2576071 RepID=A0A5R8K9G8_9BACT|nr:MSMEG_0567/Sll0786 family nitrogen starvation N-acetyltransferase [Phragmitibacter flavus]TLD68940.1 histone acetyltransferase [Phragmitibacter flavus]